MSDIQVTVPQIDDAELQAIAICKAALDYLKDPEAAHRVANYIMRRFPPNSLREEES